MSLTNDVPVVRGRLDWVAIARELVPAFAARAAAHDTEETFVADNVAELKRWRIYSAGVPAELGGGDATYHDLAAMLRTLARGCPSTALALAMHTHAVAALVWRWRHQQAPVDGLLRRIAREQLVLVSSGGSDWVDSSGTAERVAGGFRIHARKAFASGVLAGDLLVTSAVARDAAGGPAVLHFAVPLDAEGVRVVDTWHTLGMRGSGSHDVVLDGVFVPDAAVTASRPAGRWHGIVHAAGLFALPLICAVYVGIAESARDLALATLRPRPGDSPQAALAGELETALAGARLALEHMLAVATTSPPQRETTSEVMIGRTLAARFALEAVGKAMELAGGRGFYRGTGLERLWRDVQAVRYHPLQEKDQARFTGRLALGLEVDERDGERP